LKFKHQNIFLSFAFTVLLAGFFSVQKSKAQTDTSLAAVDTGRKVKVNNIFIIGNEKTKKEIILRELDFTTDFYYDWEALVEILIADQKKIYNLRLFTSVEITPLEIDDSEVEVLITVKERWYILPQLIFQLADRNFAEWWTNQGRDFSRVNFGLRLSHSNVAGRNEKLRFSGQLGFTRSLDFQYNKPYIDKKQKHGLAFQVTFNENKSIPIKSAFNRQVFYAAEDERVLRKNIGGAVRYTYRRSFYNFHFFTLGYNFTSIDPEILVQNPDYFQNGSTNLRYLYSTYTFRHDKRDNVAYATDGELLQLSITKYGIFYVDELDEVEVSITANKYWKINNRFNFNTGLTADWFLSERQPYTLVRGIGYSPDFIRGYELNVIEGQQLYVHKNSFRWKFFDREFDVSKFFKLEQFSTIPIRLYWSANFDHGYVTDRNRIPENSRLANTYLFGYGTGIDLVGFYDSVLRFEYSLNNSGEGNFFFNFKAPF
jgi:outer membrane protein assembly factor BamA